jgi:hypothetical protein
MFFAVSAARKLSVLPRVGGVPMSGVCVVRRLLVTACVIVLRSLLVVLGSVGVMFRCLAVVVGSFS